MVDNYLQTIQKHQDLMPEAAYKKITENFHLLPDTMKKDVSMGLKKMAQINDLLEGYFSNKGKINPDQTEKCAEAKKALHKNYTQICKDLEEESKENSSKEAEELLKKL
ncbi:hypothetical protein KJ632_01120 [Patescibacteria group bacterium]|nr:hypothetical protein [Patescibacteria group bacterium]